MYTPTREEIEQDNMVYTGPDLTLPTNSPALTTVPVRYGNRAADVVGSRTQSVAGWYYISVQVGAPSEDNGAAAPVPVQLDVSVTGTPEAGPQYAFASAEARQAGPFGEGKVPAAAAPQAETAPSAAGTATSSTLISPLGWAAIGAAGALVASLVVALVLRRRRAR
jgi:Ca-activated chloride channel family protein